ncbi:hypothetical protein EHI42_19740 [Rhizobium hidalgonense]|uniref:hypothetical protein n=1 Tax=Rhizobium hidalgonense TaxID=1538159 RepID=UPI000FEFE30E|nr:hypothetical protein [Rhizobium hidalgonense]RWX13629.1 hypothetical protein EHI42_19740 [Rhizobium hidalgonense]
MNLLLSFLYRRLFFASIGLALMCARYGEASEIYSIEIITEIRAVSPFTFEVGVKSDQLITIDASTKTVKSSFETGKTTILGVDLKSVRDDFKISEETFSSGVIKFTATGQTASRVGVLPDIDYTFTIKIDTSKKKIWLSGCHNEYPSYSVTANGVLIYDRTQTGTALIGLLGECDIKVSDDGKVL